MNLSVVIDSERCFEKYDLVIIRFWNSNTAAFDFFCKTYYLFRSMFHLYRTYFLLLLSMAGSLVLLAQDDCATVHIYRSETYDGGSAKTTLKLNGQKAGKINAGKALIYEQCESKSLEIVCNSKDLGIPLTSNKLIVETQPGYNYYVYLVYDNDISNWILELIASPPFDVKKHKKIELSER